MKELTMTNSDLVALVPDEFYEQCKEINWNISMRRGRPYVQGIKKNVRWSLHRYIWFLAYGELSTREMPIDHKDHNPLNNDLSNLRRITKGENNHRHQGGVYYHYQGKRQNCWRARVRKDIDGKTVTLFNKSFATKEEAEQAHEAFKREHGML